jgi:hypothetical protein
MHSPRRLVAGLDTGELVLVALGRALTEATPREQRRLQSLVASLAA